MFGNIKKTPTGLTDNKTIKPAGGLSSDKLAEVEKALLVHLGMPEDLF